MVPRPGEGYAYSEGVYYHRPAIRYDAGLCASALCAAGRDVVLTFDYALQVAAQASARGVAGRRTRPATCPSDG